jgi:N-acetylmuramoyl-L-alanine amidase
MKKYKLSIICLLLCLVSFWSIFHHNILSVFSTKRERNVIVIDVGHGGNDPGKVSADGIKETDVNLEIANYLKDYLIAQDYIVYMTRETDCGLHDEHASNKKTSDLKNRIQFFTEKKAALVVSIHQNSYSDTIQHGAQTFYYSTSDQSKMLAGHIQSSLLELDDTNTRKEKSSDSYYLLKNSSMPAVIVECGFLSNPEETAKLTDANYQKRLAYAISLGICSYDNSQPASHN